MSVRVARGARRRGLVAAGVGAAALAAACVEITTGPEGVQSLRFAAVTPSIVIGDTLRDSAGRVVPLRVVAFGRGGDTVDATGLRYQVIPLQVDSSGRPLGVTVDSITGVLVATAAARPGPVRVGAVLGGRLQVLDTIAVVPRPTALVRAATGTGVVRLRYLCTDDSPTLRVDAGAGADTGLALGNASAPLAALLLADTAPGAAVATVPVPSTLVRYTITSPATIPSGRSPFGDVRPALYVINAQVDRPIGADTTNDQGQTDARLRVLPSLLGAVVRDSLDVRVVARAFAGAALLPDSAAFTVRLIRRVPSAGAGSCP